MNPRSRAGRKEPDMASTGGLIFACTLDGRGGAAGLDWEGVARWTPDAGVLWVHLDYAANGSAEWIREKSGLDAVTCQALTAPETRPRSVAAQGGLLLILRGVNLNPDAEPDDMVSLRLWIEERRIVTLRHRRLKSVEAVRQALGAGSGPTNAAEFLADILDELLTRTGRLVSGVDDRIDALEDQVVTAQSNELRPALAALRRQAISLRRYLAPQRDVINRLQGERLGWLNESDRTHLRELADRIVRQVEDLDSVRERAAVTQEELSSRLSERTNRIIYVLAIVTAIFLPLGLITGLLGVNVGGVPGADEPWAFAELCAILLGVGVVQVLFLRKIKWL